MWSLTVSGVRDDVKLGSGFTRRRLVVRRAVDWCRWESNGSFWKSDDDDEDDDDDSNPNEDAEAEEEAEELGENVRLDRVADAIRETMVVISLHPVGCNYTEC
jgi:hypothetical protein